MAKHAKTAVVTGASSGIGRGIAQRFLLQGVNVVGIGRDLAKLRQAGTQGCEGRYLPLACDVGNADAVTAAAERALREFGEIDILVNNAGAFQSKPFTEYTQADIEALLKVNYWGVIHMTAALSPHMIQRRTGRIINISASIALQPLLQVPAAIPISIKASINAMTKALALEFSPHGVTVNAIAPGIIDTPMNPPEAHGFLAALQPLGRMGRIDDIVDMVMHLSEASFITGAVIPVDGGASSGRW